MHCWALDIYLTVALTVEQSRDHNHPQQRRSLSLPPAAKLGRSLAAGGRKKDLHGELL